MQERFATAETKERKNKRTKEMRKKKYHKKLQKK
jgi:hypothetical protein